MPTFLIKKARWARLLLTVKTSFTRCVPDVICRCTQHIYATAYPTDRFLKPVSSCSSTCGGQRPVVAHPFNIIHPLKTENKYFRKSKNKQKKYQRS
ncbi:MAG: hypothetical protein KAI83_01800 [Thiomargarita sp.]|nr:hypothetical protein [Thiomargarita sp.]